MNNYNSEKISKLSEDYVVANAKLAHFFSKIIKEKESGKNNDRVIEMNFSKEELNKIDELKSNLDIAHKKWLLHVNPKQSKGNKKQS